MDLVKLRIAQSGYTDQPDGSEARPWARALRKLKAFRGYLVGRVVFL